MSSARTVLLRATAAALIPAASPPTTTSLTSSPHDRRRGAHDRVLGLVDDAAHDVARRFEVVDRADTLSRRVALLLLVHRCALVTTQMQRVRGNSLAHLLGELAQLFGVLFDVLRPVVANGAQRLAGEPTADDGVVLVRAQQRLLVTGNSARLGRGDETRTE